MTATATLPPRSEPTSVWARLRPRSGARPTAVSRAEAPPLSPRLQLVRAMLLLVFVLTATLLIQLVLLSSLQHRAAQGRRFDAFREQLAKGTAAIGPVDRAGYALAAGTPVTFLEIPSIGVSEVIGEGTSASVLFDGPGHRRDTPLPGQVGSSVVYGRRAAFGGPFARLGELQENDLIRVTTGQGTFEYSVIGVRREGDPAPATLASGGSRLLLVTAAGSAFLPDGVLRVDAEIVGEPVIGAARVLSFSALPAEERMMAGDNRTLWVLAFWLQAMIALSVAVVWSWHRWGHAQTWVVFLPTMLLVGLATSGEFARLLPNLL
ncbi:MAG: class E sortase [Actinomycetota bacterium]|nr:class E sortase [Actinomycetota bacterium]